MPTPLQQGQGLGTPWAYAMYAGTISYPNGNTILTRVSAGFGVVIESNPPLSAPAVNPWVPGGGLWLASLQLEQGATIANILGIGARVRVNTVNQGFNCWVLGNAVLGSASYTRLLELAPTDQVDVIVNNQNAGAMGVNLQLLLQRYRP